MQQGTIQSVKADRGFGFIAIPNRGDLFFHFSQVAHELEFDEQLIGRRVEFEIVLRDGRERAINVRPAAD